MISSFYSALISALIVSLISLVGIFFIFFRKKEIDYIIFILVAFAIGAMIGNAFFHIIPESLNELEPLNMSLILVLGFLLFFIIEKTIHWRHCHNESCDKHSNKPFSYLNLIGDGVHNFLDGVLIGVSYIVSFPVGIATTVAIISHEIPQELGDFAVLLYGGFSKLKALIFNFLSASLAILGVVFAFLGLAKFNIYALPLVAGSLIYLSMSDLIPELHKEKDLKKSIISLIFIVLGLLIMYLFKLFLGE